MLNICFVTVCPPQNKILAAPLCLRFIGAVCVVGQLY